MIVLFIFFAIYDGVTKKNTTKAEIVRSEQVEVEEGIEPHIGDPTFLNRGEPSLLQFVKDYMQNVVIEEKVTTPMFMQKGRNRH